MLPILLYSNMEGSSNSLNNTASSSFSMLHDENVILNSVRSRKKVSETANCPVCSCTIRNGELDSHLQLELDRLQKLSSGGNKRKLSAHSPGSSTAMAGTSTSPVMPDEEEVDVSASPGGDVYQRVNANRLRRLRLRRRGTPPPVPPPNGECPVCNNTFPTARLQRHALRCLKRTGAEMDDDVPDTSSEEGSIDVENFQNDEPNGGSFGAEYEWCGEWRLRATALTQPCPGTTLRLSTQDQPLVVDGDEDAELYGPPQYSPSSVIAPDTDPPETDRTEESAQNGTEETNGDAGTKEKSMELVNKPNGMVEASAETRIQALKAKIREYEEKSNGSELKCLICLGPYLSPAVSIQCWHVHCEGCWLQSLHAKKVCPQCNVITTTYDLRRIYM